MNFARMAAAHLGLAIDDDGKLLGGDAAAVIEMNFDHLQTKTRRVKTLNAGDKWSGRRSHGTRQHYPLSPTNPPGSTNLACRNWTTWPELQGPRLCLSFGAHIFSRVRGGGSCCTGRSIAWCASCSWLSCLRRVHVVLTIDTRAATVSDQRRQPCYRGTAVVATMMSLATPCRRLARVSQWAYGPRRCRLPPANPIASFESIFQGDFLVVSNVCLVWVKRKDAATQHRE